MLPVLTTYPRSGTHFLKSLLSAALGVPPLESDLSAPSELRAAIAARGQHLIYGHFRFSLHSTILDEKLVPGLRMIVLTRHPFDRLISQLSFEKAVGGHLPDPTHSPQHLALHLLLGDWDGRSWQSGHVVDDFSARHNFSLRDMVTNWILNRTCHLVKFEDLISDPGRVLTGCLDFLGSSLPRESIAEITDRITFRVLTGGREPGQIDPVSHYRNGTAGEWLEAFPPAAIARLREKYRAEFLLAGYSL